MNTIEMGNPVYEYPVNIIDMQEYGVSFEELMTGKIQGARFDVHFAGNASGVKLSGTQTAVSSLTFYVEITTEDGSKISLGGFSHEGYLYSGLFGVAHAMKSSINIKSS